MIVYSKITGNPVELSESLSLIYLGDLTPIFLGEPILEWQHYMHYCMDHFKDRCRFKNPDELNSICCRDAGHKGPHVNYGYVWES